MLNTSKLQYISVPLVIRQEPPDTKILTTHVGSYIGISIYTLLSPYLLFNSSLNQKLFNTMIARPAHTHSGPPLFHLGRPIIEIGCVVCWTNKEAGDELVYGLF